MIRKKNRKKKCLERKISLLLIIASIIMGIGYASVNSIIWDISGNLLSKLQEDVFITAENPWFMRGGVFDSDSAGGIFGYSGTIGYSGAYASFRIALVSE